MFTDAYLQGKCSPFVLPFFGPLWQVPVGRATLGRIVNVIGEPIDDRGDISNVPCIN